MIEQSAPISKTRLPKAPANPFRSLKGCLEDFLSARAIWPASTVSE